MFKKLAVIIIFMKIKRILAYFAIIIIFIDLAYFYPKLTGKGVYEIDAVNITRVIDGDTLNSDIGKIRLLGINTPEKNQPYYEQAKEFLQQYEGKQVQIERTNEDKDKYGRFLRYVFYNEEFINKEILKEGLANFYSYSEDKYTSDLRKAEKEARNNEKGIWKKSTNSECITLIKLKYTEEKRCNNEEQLILNNECNSLTLTLKDNANHIYNLNIENGIFIQNFSCIFNDEGDSIFIRDSQGLVLYYNY